MTVAWMLYVLLVGVLLALGALAVDGILQRTALATRWVWVVALAGIVVLAVLAPRSPAPTKGVLVRGTMAQPATRDAASSATRTIATTLNQMLVAVRSSVNHALIAADARIPSSVATPIAVSWAILSGALLIVIVVVNRRASLARHAWPIAEVFDTQVRIAPEVGPAVMGLSHPEIVLPRWLLHRSREEQRLVVVHEREHVAARDQLLPVGGWIVAALFPWHPAVWWALSRLRLAIELDCDARVLNQGVQPRSYGTLLIDIAGQCAGHRAGALALADRPSPLERRLLAMNQTRPRFTLVRSGTLGALAALSILVACEARLPTSAEVEKMDVASAEKALVQAKLLDERGVKNVVYKVDGVVVSAERAHALSAKRIATVNVSKGAPLNTRDSGTVYTTVNVTTGGEEKGVPLPITGDNMKLTTERVTLTDKKAFAGLLYVDGVLQPSGSLAALAPGDIMSVEVFKGLVAANVFGDSAAKNGVIYVTTRHAKQQ